MVLFIALFSMHKLASLLHVRLLNIQGVCQDLRDVLCIRKVDRNKATSVNWSAAGNKQKAAYIQQTNYSCEFLA
jgi:hypothetical protein